MRIIRKIQGVSEMVFSFPAALVADNHLRRDTCLRAAGAFGFVCVVVLTYAFNSGQLYMLYAADAVLGMFLAAHTPPLEALFIDSIPFGERTAPLLTKNSIMYAAMATMGPILSIIGFLWFGNTWKLPQLDVMMYVGIVFLTVACAVLFFCQDQRNGVGDGHGDPVDTTTPLRTPTMVGTEVVDVTFDESDARRDEAQQTKQLFPLLGLQELESEDVVVVTTLCGWLSEKHVPWLLYLSDIITYQADGITINFLTVFLMKEYGLPPIQVEIAARYGRVVTMVSFRALNIIVALLMCYVPWLPLVILLLLLRVGITCSVTPLSLSLLMDSIPENERAKWNAFDSVARFFFAESTIVGGYLIDHFGSYRVCFADPPSLCGVVVVTKWRVQMKIQSVQHTAHLPVPNS
ncbi:TPA: LOW QUALITY PROTEIN: hypothetical protein N0F65_005642 [Lagenidium giganteum]|uniref:Uncharacterized protein n=1 Tax=Lagenidium giganteum TaxID=4803 RepID=A0AAV2YV36_9STRA|nr:TPA: LOW QUALITY PROTEIN: hypothetical protein N0F65_005642 [Lagenidium giganteum]